MSTRDSLSIDAVLVDDDHRPARRRILGVGTAFVAGLATVLAHATPANADCQNSPCCSLVFCTKCSTKLCGGWSCPSGYVNSWWTCTSGGRNVLCGECTRSTNCFDGTYTSCSIWFFTG